MCVCACVFSSLPAVCLRVFEGNTKHSTGMETDDKISSRVTALMMYCPPTLFGRNKDYYFMMHGSC